MKDLKAAIYMHLPQIDEVLEERRLPVHKRSFQASILFVQECVIEVSPMTKEELILGEHFSIIVNHSLDWYIEKYGELAENPKKEILSGITRYRNQPVLLNIPFTTSKTEKEGETAWLSYPDHLQADELHFNLFNVKISLESLSETELEILKTEVEEVVALSRRTNISLMMESGLNEGAKNMSGSIWAHIEKAISDILSQKKENLSVACWELHLAVEKALKVYISQFPIEEKPWGHDLIELCKQAKLLGLVIDKALLETLPNYKDAIKLRYGELQVDSRTAIKYYLTALKLVCSITEQLKREFSIYNASFLIKKSGWAR
jgi:HEPN domain-containing protein